ncbi:Uncharacterised protein [Capnocytophaga canimorsus]|nr:hypothetical protein CLV61_0142 [Capnocytophaga canimorsus]STA72534.1 Uncharacterised protein [Capnocytophaga canimorsus]VEJ19431.1 Uncharacterised protein [Capnocytophaga canimorsus]
MLGDKNNFQKNLILTNILLLKRVPEQNTQ